LVSVGEQSTEYVEILLDETIKQNSKILTKGVFDVTN
jgi:cobalt-zinc-cadmium efflux system membrane fusion protein